MKKVLIITLSMFSFLSWSQTRGDISCKSPMNSQAFRLYENNALDLDYRCFDTGDIWQDCDSVSGQAKQISEKVFTYGEWTIEFYDDFSKAALLLEDSLYGKLSCSYM